MHLVRIILFYFIFLYFFDSRHHALLYYFKADHTVLILLTRGPTASDRRGAHPEALSIHHLYFPNNHNSALS